MPASMPATICAWRPSHLSISHLSYVSPDIRLTYIPLISSTAYDGASASGLGFLFKSLISTPPGRLGESVATVMEA